MLQPVSHVDQLQSQETSRPLTNSTTDLTGTQPTADMPTLPELSHLTMVESTTVKHLQQCRFGPSLPIATEANNIYVSQCHCYESYTQPFLPFLNCSLKFKQINWPLLKTAVKIKNCTKNPFLLRVFSSFI